MIDGDSLVCERDVASAPHAPADHARRLLSLVRALDLSDLTLVVHDFGGPIGLKVALEEPARVRSLAVMNTWAWPHGDDPSIRRVSRFVASPIGRFLSLWLNASPRWLVPASFGDRKKLTREIHRHYGRSVRHAGRARRAVDARERARGVRSVLRVTLGPSRRARLDPATIVWGMRDPAFGASYLARWRELFPKASVIELEHAGHFPQEEEPARVTDAIRASGRPALG